MIIGPSESNSESSDASDEQFVQMDRHKFSQKRSFSLKKRLPIPAVVTLPPDLHNTLNLNIQLNSPDIFSGKLNSSYGVMHDDESSLDVSSPRDNNSPMVKRRNIIYDFKFNP